MIICSFKEPKIGRGNYYNVNMDKVPKPAKEAASPAENTVANVEEPVAETPVEVSEEPTDETSESN